VLRRLREAGDPEWVLPGRIPGRPLVGLRKAWYRIRAVAKLDTVRLHDLRHSFASMGAASGLSLPIIGALLGHTQAATTQRYAHLASDPVRQASDLIGERLAGAMRGNGSAEVVPLRSRS
jgi:integrase